MGGRRLVLVALLVALCVPGLWLASATASVSRPSGPSVRAPLLSNTSAAADRFPVQNRVSVDSAGQPEGIPVAPQNNPATSCGCGKDTPQGTTRNNGNFSTTVALNPGIATQRSEGDDIGLFYHSQITYDGPYGHNWSLNLDQRIIPIPTGALVKKVPEGNDHNVDPSVPAANLWLCTTGPCSGPGEGMLRVVEHATNVHTGDQNSVSIEDGLGAYEFSVEYDNFVIQSLNPCDIVFGPGSDGVVNGLPAPGSGYGEEGLGANRGPVDELNTSAMNPDCSPDPNALNNGTCSMSFILENIIHFGCTTSGPLPPGPTGDMNLASLKLIPHPDLVNDLFPGNNNGVVTVIKDNGCELVDVFGHAVLGSVNGGLTAICGDLAVTVRILEGDLNLDCKVDGQDQQLIAYRYNSFFGENLYSKWFDLEPALHDLDIDIKDLQKVFGRDGSTCQDPVPAQPPAPPPAPLKSTGSGDDLLLQLQPGMFHALPKGGDLIHMDGSGRSLLYQRQLDGSFKPPPGFYTELSQHADGSFSLRDRHGTTTQFDAAGRSTQTKDRNGNVRTIIRDGGGRITRVVDPLGRNIDLAYNPGERLGSVTDFAGRTTTLTYDGQGDLREVTTPAVTGTPNGNDFPAGKTTRYTYSSGDADERLNHNLLTITAPNEAATSGPPRLVNVYGTTPGGYAFDRLVGQSAGGTNASGVPAGGTYTISYTQLNPVLVSADPNLPRNRTTITDRNGNVTRYEHNGLGNELEVRELTSGVRPGDPPAFVTKHEYNDGGQLTQTVLPEGNSVQYDYDVGAPSRFQQGNLLEEKRLPGPRGGDQTQIVTRYSYEPIYNEMRTQTEARGNDPGYVPQNGGANSPGRYTTTHSYDYEESCNPSAIGPQAGLSPTTVQSLLTGAGMCGAPLGDVNGDGTSTQVSGNPIRVISPPVHLLPGSNEAAIEGGTLQPIVTLTAYNQAGQVTKSVDAEGNVDLYDYHPENDPDGDGLNLTPSVGVGPLGYLKQITRDAVSAAPRDSGANPAPTSIRTAYVYDRVGNKIREVDGRGIATDYAVNSLNQTVQVTRAAAHNLLAPAPPEPVALTDFAYLERTFYDFNDNVIRSQVEDRGNTSGVGADNAGSGTAFVDTTSVYDVEDKRVQMRQEVSDSEQLVTRYRYDPNGNQLLVILPEGNASTSRYDERDLPFQSTRGATASPPGVLLAGIDPTNYDVRGGLASTTTSNYDRNRNLVEGVDADDTDGSAANNSAIAGAGDRTRVIYDGFDRRTSRVDSAGNQTVTQYDPAGNMVRETRFGPAGGVSPAADGPATLPGPVSSAGVIQAANLVNTHLLASSETRYDELRRSFQTDRALFVNTIPAVRTPDVDDGATSLGKGDLTPGDSCAVPGVAAPPSGYIGCVSSRTEYDRAGRVAFSVQDDGDTSRALYDGVGWVIEAIDPAGNTTETAYDDNGNVIETRETDKAQAGAVADEVFLTTNFYDNLNRLQRTVDNVGETMDYRYDSRDNLAAQGDASGPAGAAISRRAFTGGALTLNTTNLFGNVTRYFYDGVGRQVRSESVLTASGHGDGANIGADLFGVKTATPAPDVTQGGGDGIIRTGTNWDENSQQSSLLDDQGNATVYLYDNLDRRITETKGLTVNTAPLDKAKVLGSRNVVAPAAATINSPSTIATAKIDTQLAAAKTRINAVAGLFPAFADSVDDHPPTTTAYGYDPDGNLLILEDENDSETFTRYDALNRRIALRVFRSGEADSFAGDPVFAPAPASDPANLSTAFPAIVGTTKQDFQYDGLSRLVRATDNNDPAAAADDSLVTNAYDSLSRQIEEQQQIGALPAKAVDSAWRAENLRADVTYPQSGSFSRQLDYTYDGLDRLQTVQDTGAAQPIADYDYIGAGRVLQRSYPQNGTRLTYLNNAGTADAGYDGLRRTAQLRHLRADNSLVAGFTHTYDRMSNKLSETKLHNAANNENYNYDAAYRLTHFQRPDVGAITPLHSNWTLDGAGNWKQVDAETRQHSSFNEITQRNATAVLSDDNGNEFDDGTLTLTWDFQNRLRYAVRKSDSAFVGTYSYDALGRRIRKVVTNSGALNGTTNFYLNGDQEIEERDGADGLRQQYVYGVYVDEPLVLDRNLGGGDSAIGAGDQRLFYHQNTLSSTFALTDTAGAIVEGYQYDAYGRPTVFAPGANTVVDFGGDDVVTNGTSAVANPYLFTGRRLDPETQLYYYRARYLNTEQGRFISRAYPSHQPIEVRTYDYVGGRPTYFGDPEGHPLPAIPLIIVGGAAAWWYFFGPGTPQLNPSPPVPEECGLCGVDITESLDATLNRVEFDFRSKGRGTQHYICHNIHSLTGWDVLTLIGEGPVMDLTKGECGKGNCAYTVTVNGECHWAFAVNYALWGRINKVCYDEPMARGMLSGPQFTLSAAVGFARFNRLVKTLGGLLSYPGAIEAPVAWTRFGYTGDYSHASPYNMNSKCAPCSEKYNFTLHYRLAPRGLIGIPEQGFDQPGALEGFPRPLKPR